jgi:hypothetical protein
LLQALKHSLLFGIGVHHAGLNERDRDLVEELFVNQKIQVRHATHALSHAPCLLQQRRVNGLRTTFVGLTLIALKFVFCFSFFL